MTLQSLTSKPYALFFEALANPARIQVLNLLRENGSLSVSQIGNELGLEQTHISHSLRCLAFCGLVTANPEGRLRIYSINEKTMLPLLQIVDEHLKKYASNLLSCDVLER